MGKFVHNLKIEVEFDGDRVAFVVRPMSRAAVIRLRGLTQGLRADDPAAGEAATMAMVDCFAEHVLSVEGALDAAGNAVSRETVFEAAYFLPAITEAATEWGASSMPSQGK